MQLCEFTLLQVFFSVESRRFVHQAPVSCIEQNMYQLYADETPPRGTFPCFVIAPGPLVLKMRKNDRDGSSRARSWLCLCAPDGSCCGPFVRLLKNMLYGSNHKDVELTSFSARICPRCKWAFCGSFRVKEAGSELGCGSRLHGAACAMK